MSPGAAGAAGGALWGGLIGLIFLAPLIALGSSGAPEKVIERLRPFGGEVIQTSLDADQEEHLRAALGGVASAG